MQMQLIRFRCNNAAAEFPDRRSSAGSGDPQKKTHSLPQGTSFAIGVTIDRTFFWQDYGHEILPASIICIIS